MALPVTLYRAAASQVYIGGTPVTAIYGPVSFGLIVNPLSAADQGVPQIENIYVDLVNPAALGETTTTVPVPPGGSFFVPPGTSTDVSVNAATTGHKFSAISTQMPGPGPYMPAAGTFPPPGPTTFQTIATNRMGSYLYQQYTDDDSLQAFIAAYNTIAQQYIDTFNQLNLPVYTGLSGGLLDWVAQGLYGMSRPSLSSGLNRDIGPFGTWVIGKIPFGSRVRVGSQNVVVTTDDIFQRCITWNFYKGDGKVFNIRWLKRRIMRFLEGTNGTAPNIDQTYVVSVTFGVGNQVNVAIGSGQRRIVGGAIFGRFVIGTTPFSILKTRFTPGPAVAYATQLQEAINAGVLELPFQYNVTVVVG